MDEKVASFSESQDTDGSGVHRKHLQTILELRLIGKELADGVDPDEYVRRLREGWDDQDDQLER